MVVMEWYSWLGLVLLPVVLIGYMIYKKKRYS